MYTRSIFFWRQFCSGRFFHCIFLAAFFTGRFSTVGDPRWSPAQRPRPKRRETTEIINDVRRQRTCRLWKAVTNSKGAPSPGGTQIDRHWYYVRPFRLWPLHFTRLLLRFSSSSLPSCRGDTEGSWFCYFFFFVFLLSGSKPKNCNRFGLTFLRESVNVSKWKERA